MLQILLIDLETVEFLNKEDPVLLHLILPDFFLVLLGDFSVLGWKIRVFLM